MQAARLLHRPTGVVPACQRRVRVDIRAPVALRNIRLRIAAIDEQTSFQLPQDGDSSLAQPPTRSVPEIDPELARELEVEELDAAQEQLLSWMMLGEDEQEEDLDEMVGKAVSINPIHACRGIIDIIPFCFPLPLPGRLRRVR